jgi:hypothetical protein
MMRKVSRESAAGNARTHRTRKSCGRVSVSLPAAYLLDSLGCLLSSR